MWKGVMLAMRRGGDAGRAGVGADGGGVFDACRSSPHLPLHTPVPPPSVPPRPDQSPRPEPNL